jgi:RNA polymerase sigma factor (sigma-70 family)
MDSSDDKRDRVLKAALDCRTELISYARSLLGNYAAAADVLQEAMLVVVKKFDQFQEGTSMLAWCRSIVRLEVLRSNQRRQRERSLAERFKRRVPGRVLYVADFDAKQRTRVWQF